jgi:hypothetical protein
MRILATLAVLLSTLSLVAGCLDSGPTADVAAPVGCPESRYDLDGLRIVPTTTDPIVDDKDQALEFETTNVRTCSLPAIGWSALDPDGTPHKYLGELDMRGDLGLGAVAVVGSGEPGRVYLVDIADRENPEVLSFIDLPGAHVTDVKISDDGKVLYVASQALPTLELATGTAPDIAASSGFTVYGLADPTNPTYLGTVPDEGIGCHMLDPVQVSATQDAVMCISSNLKSYLVQRDGARIIPFGFVEYFPDVDGVPTPSSVSALGDPTCSLPAPAPSPGLCALSSGPHDMTAFHTNGAFGDGESYLVVSHWGEGVKVLDITGAPVITEVGSWKGEGAAHYNGNVHTAMMFEAGGKRYIVASPEYTSAGTVPGLWVLDATDLSALKLVAEWYHPGLHDSQGLFLTTHQWQVAPTGGDVAADDVRIYLTMNHGGLWVLDFGAILRGDDQGAILGFNLARTPIPEDHVGNAILSTWDVNVVDGYIYGTDRATGLWVFHYTGDEYDDVRLTGFA